MTEEKKQNNEGIKPFQVVDRRRFDSDGNDRTEGAAPAPDAPQIGTESAAANAQSARPTAATPRSTVLAGTSGLAGNGTQSRDSAHVAPNDSSQGKSSDGDDVELDADDNDGEYRPEASENPDEDVTLSSFIMSLATQTMVQLGEMDPPPGMEIPPDPESARQTIDIISMLQRKTRGNVSSEEARFMKDVLHTLRMSYVRRAQ